MKTIEEKANAYDEVVNKLRHFILQGVDPLITRADVQDFFPELAESEDMKIRKDITILVNDWWDRVATDNISSRDAMLAWLEKQGYEPNWCHHKVDLSDCSEEYRKAYYDGWNNCNMQHEQCNAEHKPEPKFKVGNIISNGNVVYRVDEIAKNPIGQDCYLLVDIEKERKGTRYHKVYFSDGDVCNNGETIWLCEQVDRKFWIKED